ncbi:MAG: hypothetical protein HN566_05465 [Polaribacter sp.]|nr:hypothetical protein [Polaribacter sp.]
MDEIIRMLLSMGKTKEEIAEFVGKEMPKGGVDNVASNVLKPLTRKVAGDFPLIGSRITDPTQTGQYGKYNIQALDTMDRYPLIRQSIEDQKLNWEKTLKFIREGGYSLSALQKQNLNFNLGVLQRSKVVLKDIEKGLTSEGQNVEEIYQEFVRNKRFLGNEKTGLSSEGNSILEFIEKTRGKLEDFTKTTKNQEQILKDQKAANDKRMKRLYEGRAYEGAVGTYRALGGYHLPKLHEAGIINLDPKIYEAIKAGRYHHGGAEFFAPDPNRVLQYHFGSKIFDDLDKAIDEAALKGGDIPLKGPEGMIKFLKDNDYLPFKVNGPANAIDYLKPDELLERIKEIEASSEVIKKGNSPFFKTPDEIMGRVMQNANEKKLYLESFQRTHPEKYKLYEKTQSEEPFFALGDVNQPDPFSDLSDITTPKDKGDLLPFPKKKKVKPVDENKRQMTDEEYDEFIDDIGGEERLEAYNFDGTVGDAARILKEDKAYEAEMFDMYKTGKLDPEAGSVTRARMNFLKQRLEEAEGSGDTRLISEDEIFELEGLMKKFRKEDIEFKVNEQPERKLTDEEIKELKDLTDNDDFDLAEGGIIKLAKGGRIGFATGSPNSLMPMQQQQMFDALNQGTLFDQLPAETPYSKAVIDQETYTPFGVGRIKDDFDRKTKDAFATAREINKFKRLTRDATISKDKFDKQGYSSDIRHGLGSSAFKDSVTDYITSNLGVNADTNLFKGITPENFGSFATNVGSLFTEIPDMFSQAKAVSEDVGPYSGIIDYMDEPDTRFLTQPIEDIKANYVGSKLPFSLRNNKAAKMDFLNNYKNYGDQTMNFIKEKRRQEIQAKIKRAEIAQKQKEAAAAKEAAQRAATRKQAAQNRSSGSGGYQSSFSQDSGFMDGSGTAAEMGSFAKGGIVGLKR